MNSDVLLQQCRAAQARHQLFAGSASLPAEQPLTVVVAVSGGADSVALLHLLYHLTAEWRLTLHVAHLDHNLRQESAVDAQFVAQLAQTWGLPFHHQQLSPAALTGAAEGLEAAARRARYGFLTQVAARVTPTGQVPVIALAHQANDQAETVLMHLVRGSGLRGLGGMRWVSQRLIGDLWPTAPPDQGAQPIQLVRPLLGAQRADILHYLQTHELAWREDSSNADQRFVRNQLRHSILPSLLALNPNLLDTLARTAQIVQQEADRLSALDQATLVTVLVEPRWSSTAIQAWHAQSRTQQEATAPARVVLDLAGLAAQSVAAQRGVLRAALTLLAAPTTNLDFAHSESILTALPAPWRSSGPHPLVGAVAWSVVGASATTPARLSLHRKDVLPFAPTHPWLDAQWRTAVGCLPLADTGPIPVSIPVSIPVYDDWVLNITCGPGSALPDDWRSPNHPWQTYVDAARVGKLVLTTPRPGQRFAPLGLAGRHKALGDFFTDRKIPGALRSGWPLIVDAMTDAVLWVCGEQPGHHARLTPNTQVVLRLTWHHARNGQETTHAN